MQEWAEVHRLFHREKCSKAEIGDRLGMSRTTVYRLLALTEPPTYERGQPALAAGSPQGHDRRAAVRRRRGPGHGHHSVCTGAQSISTAPGCR